MIKFFSFFGAASVSFLYAVGFIYDSAQLEVFNIRFFQLLGTPIEYLVFGANFLFHGFVRKFSYVFYFLGVVGCAYKPLERRIKEIKSIKYIDMESIPYILISLMFPLLLFLSFPIISTAQQDAKELISKNIDINNNICYSTNGKSETHRGFIVRNRDGLILFYDVEQSATILVPQRNILHSLCKQESIRGNTLTVTEKP